MLRLRLLTAAVGIPALLAVAYAGGWYLAGLVSLTSLLAVRELFRLAAGADRPTVHPALSALGHLLAVGLPLAQSAAGDPRVAEAGAVAGTGLALAAGLRAARRHRVGAGVAGAGALLVPSLLSYLVLLRGLGGLDGVVRIGPALLPAGACWLFLSMATCWAADTGAYGVGHAWGRRKLWPAVSPGKTIEGVVGGLVAAVVLGLAVGRLLGLRLWVGALLGGAVALAGLVGDLSESKLKRWAGVKDSGRLLPGHGGVLDRFDSLLLGGPVAYYLLRALGP